MESRRARRGLRRVGGTDEYLEEDRGRLSRRSRTLGSRRPCELVRSSEGKLLAGKSQSDSRWSLDHRRSRALHGKNPAVAQWPFLQRTSSRSVDLRMDQKDNTTSTPPSSSRRYARRRGKREMKPCSSLRKERFAESNLSKSGDSKGAPPRRGRPHWQRATPPTSWQPGRSGLHLREPPRWAQPGVSQPSATRLPRIGASTMLAYARSQTRRKRGRP